jgi:hypothetical protein
VRVSAKRAREDLRTQDNSVKRRLAARKKSFEMGERKKARSFLGVSDFDAVE